MDISNQLHCLFNAEIQQQNGSYVIEIPERELSIGELQEDRTYRVGMFQSTSTDQEAEHEPEQKPEPERRQRQPEPPVEEGEFREVEITDLGDQGDGLTHIDGGFVVIVPDADIGDQATVKITHLQENYAIGEIVQDRQPEI